MYGNVAQRALGSYKEKMLTYSGSCGSKSEKLSRKRVSLTVLKQRTPHSHADGQVRSGQTIDFDSEDRLVSETGKRIVERG